MSRKLGARALAQHKYISALEQEYLEMTASYMQNVNHSRYEDEEAQTYARMLLVAYWLNLEKYKIGRGNCRAALRAYMLRYYPLETRFSS